MGRDVEAMFDDIAPAYDRTNTVLSLGLHKAWKRRAVGAALPLPGDRVLDVATGTGDLARLLAERVAPHGLVAGLDFSAGMLRVAVERGTPGQAVWLRGDAMRLPLPDATFSAATIAFGIRNVDRPVEALAEMRRVLRPGGRLVVLEFGQPTGLLRWPYRFYSRVLMPRIGSWMSGNRAAYQYLPETAARFPAGERFLDLLRQAGFTDVRATRLSGGIAWIYVAVR